MSARLQRCAGEQRCSISLAQKKLLIEIAFFLLCYAPRRDARSGADASAAAPSARPPRPQRADAAGAGGAGNVQIRSTCYISKHLSDYQMTSYAQLQESNAYQPEEIEEETTPGRGTSRPKRKLCLIMVVGLFVSTLVVIMAQSSMQPNLEPCSDDLQLPPHSGCNREEALCARSYNEVSYATMHNAFATSQDGFVIAQHRACMRSGLKSGIRAFMLDAYLITASDELKLCHESCVLGSSSLTKTLGTFEEFLRLNPREVVTIIWEFKVEGQQKRSPQDIASLKRLFVLAMKSTGLLPYLHSQIPQYSQEWPTLDDMIATNSRLVSLSDTRAYLDELWDMHTYDHAIETKFDSKSKAELDKSCVLDRGLSRYNSLLILNHFTVMGAIGIDITVTDTLAEFTGIDNLLGINREPYMWNRISDCAQCLGRLPNFVAVDFWESSDVIQVVQKLNTVSFEQSNSTCIY